MKTSLQLIKAVVGLAGLLVAPGCVVQGDNDGASYLDVAWGIEYVGGGVINCAQAGTTTVGITARNVQTGVPYQESFPCGTGNGLSSDLPEGQYSVTFELKDELGDLVSTLTLPNPGDPAPVIVDRRQETVIDVVFVVQSFSLGWSIERGTAPGIPLTCAQVGATRVELEVAWQTGEPVVFSFDCAPMAGVTVAVPVGNTNIVVWLLDAAGKPLSSTPKAAFVVPETTRAVLPAVRFTVN